MLTKERVRHLRHEISELKEKIDQQRQIRAKSTMFSEEWKASRSTMNQLQLKVQALILRIELLTTKKTTPHLTTTSIPRLR